MADLLALTFGAAIAASLYWYSNKGGSNTVAGGSSAAVRYFWFSSFIELLQKSCVALTPVILLRRWQAGGPIQPIAYLPILVSFGQISNSIWNLPILGIVYEDLKISSGKLVNMEAFEVWKLAQGAIGIVAAALAFARRRRPPDWIFGLLVAIAWDRLAYAWEVFYQTWGNERITSQGWPLSVVRLFSVTVIQGPIGVVAYFPLAIVLVDLRRAPWRRWGWVEWAAAWLTLPLPLLIRGRYLAQVVILVRGFPNDHVIIEIGWMASIGLAYLVARVSEPAWRRFLEGSSDHADLNASASKID
jgi:hypothetical protein